ncbi:MAG: NADH-quinone oxidoreductase subunit NuoE [Anaerolineae bacterium]|nr:NADH-quinone oxidoreductase subunit NuoE [Anaerolineae bacterium]
MDELLTQQIDEVIHRYGANQEALVEILRDLNQSAGHLTRDHLDSVALRLGLPHSQVYSVASFYSMISLKPLGKHVIRFCEDAPCHVAGGRQIWDTLERELGIPFGETTPDGEWSLLTTSCIGACAVGPVMMVDDEIYGNLTPEKVGEILARYRDYGETEGGIV